MKFFQFNSRVGYKLLIFSTLLILNLRSGLAQVEMQWSDELFLTSKNNIPQIVGYDESGYYMLTDDYSWAIEKLDSEMQHAGIEYLDLNKGLRTFKLVAVVHFHDSLYLFTSEMRMRSMVLYVETIDKETLKQNEDKRRIIEVFNLGGWTADFQVKLSKLEQKLLISDRIVIYGSKTEEVHFMVYGPGMAMEWEARENIQHDQKIYEKAEFVVDDSGNAYMISLYFDPALIEHLSPRKNSYSIIACTDTGQSVRTYNVDISEKYIRGIAIEPGVNNDLVVAGFYSPSINDYTVDGVFYFAIDYTTKEKKHFQLHEFAPYFIEENMDRKQDKKLKYLYSYNLDHVALRKNGNMILVAEQVYEQTFDTHKNLIVICLTPEGEISWERTVIKSQNHDVKSYPNYSSYAFLAPHDRDKVEIIFNNHLKNMSWELGQPLKNFQYNNKSYLLHITLGEIGEVGQETIYIREKKKMLIPAPIYFYDMKNHEMIIPALKYRKYKFVKIGFE
ncbi:MAG: hypothetical protein ISS19_12530 [Bacteroidales bacterium]|nr:hypothetical protein [Bacteroidales bacterium]